MEDNKELKVIEEKTRAFRKVEGIDQCYEDVVLDLKFYHGMIGLLCEYGRKAMCGNVSDSEYLSLEQQNCTFEVLLSGIKEIIYKLDKYA